jgi:ubiquinone biosynthesis protein COQ4
MSNPDDTAQVFRIIDALSGPATDRVLSRFADTPSGRALLDEKPDLLSRLLDRAAMGRLPEGSLGREYLCFLEREGITTEGLVEASRAGRYKDHDLPADLVFLRNRMRDTHDLWHVVTGYHGDLIGEASLLAFTFAQTRNPGIGLVIAAAWMRGRESHVRSMILAGLRRGLRAAWLPAVRWEDLLHLPVAEVRRRLRIDPPPTYQTVRTSDYLAARAA